MRGGEDPEWHARPAWGLRGFCSYPGACAAVRVLALVLTPTPDRAVCATRRHQTAAWHAGHKKECVAKAAAQLAPAAPTEADSQLQARLSKLETERDSLGVLSLEEQGLALGGRLRKSDPKTASWIFNLFGLSHFRTGGYARASALHEQDRAICESLGDREGVARACCNLGLCFHSTGEYARAAALHEQDRAICESLGDLEGVARACCNLGLCFYHKGDYARASALHKQGAALSEELGDHAGVARACVNQGNCCYRQGDYGRAREWHEQARAMAEALGDRAGVAKAHGNLGLCYYRTGDYARARELHELRRALAQELGDRSGVAVAYSNLGDCCFSTGDYMRARELHEQARALSEELGDRAGVARAWGNLGRCYHSTGDYARARSLHEQYRAMLEELGDRAGVAGTCGNLGQCCINTGDYGRAISYLTEQYSMATEMQVETQQADAALGMGVALRLEVRASVRGRAAGAAELPAPHASAPACGDDAVREAEKWLQTALDLGHRTACLHLAYLAFDTGQDETALAHLHDYLSSCVEQGRNRCAGCYQTRGGEAQMLTCGGCRVARFCSVQHQKMASKSVAAGGSLLEGRHKDVCSLLGKWRQRVLKDGASPDALRVDLLAFLRQ